MNNKSVGAGFKPALLRGKATTSWAALQITSDHSMEFAYIFAVLTLLYTTC